MPPVSLGETFTFPGTSLTVHRMGFGVDFEVESYLNHQGNTFLDRFDAGSLHSVAAVPLLTIGSPAHAPAVEEGEDIADPHLGVGAIDRASVDAEMPVAGKRLRDVEVQLDQCWDLLRQRRARREFGRNPDDADVRDAGTVEGYTG